MRKVLLILLFAILVAGGYFAYQLMNAMSSLDVSGPDVGNNERQLLACTGAQMAVKQRLTFASQAIFPFCSSVPVIGTDNDFIVQSFFDLADSSGIKRRHSFSVNAKRRPDGNWQTLITRLD